MQFVTQFNSSYVINNYNNSVNKLTTSNLKEKKSNAKEYNKALYKWRTKGKYDPDTIVGKYDVLQIGDTISYLDIPSIDLYLPIYNSTDENVLQVGIGHQEKTSLPIGGKNTNCVLLGHSGLTTNTLFTNLQDINKGDTFYLHTLDEKLAYKVTEIYTILPEDLNKYMTIQKDKDIVTLITCVPVGINTHRLIVIGERTKLKTNNNTNKKTSVNDTNNNSFANVKSKLVLYIVLCASILLLIIIFLICVFRKKKRKDKLKK
jgi:LPXTG-site transpeptidase (sortase) family protein